MPFIIEKISEEQRENFAKKAINNPLLCGLPILNPTSWVIDHQKDVYLFGIGTHRDYPDEDLFYFHWKDLEFILPLRKQNQMPNTRIWSLDTTWESPIVIMAFDRKQELLMDLKEALLIYKLDGTLTADNQAVKVEFEF